MLLKAGITPDLARFAQTHGQWNALPDIALDDLIVALADSCWKGKRDAILENKIVDLIAAATRTQTWQIFVPIDTIIEHLARDAESRIAWQTQFSVR